MLQYFSVYAFVKEILLRFKEIYMQIPLAQYCRKLFSYSLHTKINKESAFWSKISLCGAAGQRGFSFKPRNVYNSREAVIGGLVKDGTI